MGEVYIARTPWPDHPVAAVKRLRPDVARVPTFAERFQHEAQLAVRLDHPNVVGTLDIGSVEDQLYVASELILGKDTGFIADRLRRRSQGGPAAVALRLLIDALEGLAYVHGVREPDGKALRLVHRDVTPGNVLVGYDGRARLADFGLAKSLLTEKSHLTQHGEILGTPNYLPPEIIRGESASPASDLYGLGAVMYRFLTGIAPHHGTTAEVLLKVLQEEIQPLSELRPDLPSWLSSLIHRMLEKDARRRPAEANQVISQLAEDVKRSDLLVPRALIGRWLSELFAAEKANELEEYEHLVAMDPYENEGPRGGTVVLARPREGSQLQAPVVDGLDFETSEGTELEIREAEVSRVRSEFADEELDVPTRTGSMPGVESYVTYQDDETGPSSSRYLDTLDSDSELTRLGSMAESATDEDGDQLPGFVDDRGGYDSSPTKLGPAAAAVPEESGPSAGGVMVSAVDAGSPPESVVARPAHRTVPAEPAVQPRAAAHARDGNLRRRASVATRQSADPPPDRIAKSLFLVGMLLLGAVVLGVVIGGTVAGFRREAVRGQLMDDVQTLIDASLAERFNRAYQEIERRTGAGESVPARAMELMRSARTDAASGNAASMRAHLSDLVGILDL